MPTLYIATCVLTGVVVNIADFKLNYEHVASTHPIGFNALRGHTQIIAAINTFYTWKNHVRSTSICCY